MKPKLISHLILALAFICSRSGAQQTAVTEDGKKVILKVDGTWEYIKEQPKKSDSFDFRKTTWGMSKKQVMSTESAKIERDDEDVLAYSGTVSNMEALIAYIFAEGKLVRAKYVFLPVHTNENDYIIDYDNLKEILTKKYGKPISDEHYWRDKLYQDDFSKWGFAVSLGHLTYYSKWETERSTVFLGLSGENYKVNLVTEYKSKQLASLEEKANEKKKSSEF
jgi:hypothetical protein